jgi:hypothetical protein
MEKGGGNGNVEKSRTCWSAECLAIGNEVVITFTIIFRM